MDLFTNLLNTLGSGATAYILANRLRDPQTRPNTLAGFQLAESGAVPYLTGLANRASAEGDTWLAEKLTIHAADEKRHGQIFAHGLKQLGKQAKTRDEVEQPNQSQDKPTNASAFFAKYYQGFDLESRKPENIEWLVFMASTYILELDASKDFARMATALPEDEPQSHNLKLGILSIAQDESSHAAYLYEAMHRRLSAREVKIMITEWRKHKIDAMFASVADIILTGGNSNSLVKDGAPTEIEQSTVQLVEV